MRRGDSARWICWALGALVLSADGLVSQTEFMRVRLPLFNPSDKNDDGKLSEEEITAAYEARRK